MELACPGLPESPSAEWGFGWAFWWRLRCSFREGWCWFNGIFVALHSRGMVVSEKPMSLGLANALNLIGCLNESNLISLTFQSVLDDTAAVCNFLAFLLPPYQLPTRKYTVDRLSNCTMFTGLVRGPLFPKNKANIHPLDRAYGHRVLHLTRRRRMHAHDIRFCSHPR